MTSKDIALLADTLALRAGFDQPLSIAEMKSTAAQLRSFAARVEAMENKPVPPSKRFAVIDGGGGTAA